MVSTLHNSLAETFVDYQYGDSKEMPQSRSIYLIQLSHLRLDFSKMLEKNVVKYVSTYITCALKKGNKMQSAYQIMLMRCFSMFRFFFLTFFLKAYVVGTHLNCIDLLMQFKLVPETCAFIQK